MWYVNHVFMVDILYSLSIDYPEYCIMFVCNIKVTTLIWRLQQVNQCNWEFPPSPQQAYSTLLY